jgi:hypothetical protein
VTNAPKPEPDDTSSGRGPTAVPPRGGKGKGGARGSAPARPQANRGPKGRQARQAAQRRNRLLGGLAVVVVVAVIAVVVIVAVTSKSASGAPRQPAPAAAVQQMQGVPVSTLTQAANVVTQLSFAQTAKGGALTENGKPVVLFIGAEFCPICAAERWPMTLALMKFGQFTGLQQTHSAKVDGDAGTWSYYGATYSSQYLVFKHFELYTNQPLANYYKTLEKLPAQEQGIWSANQGSSESFPFVDFAGKEILTTAQYNPSIIYFKSFNDILGDVGANDNTIGASIDAAAAVFTKYLCGLTNNQPGDVCSAVAKVPAPIVSGTSGSSTPAGH